MFSVNVLPVYFHFRPHGAITTLGRVNQNCVAGTAAGADGAGLPTSAEAIAHMDVLPVLTSPLIQVCCVML